MNPYVSVILTIAVCLLLFVLWIIYENYKNKKRILTKIRRNWGKPYTRQYEPGDIEQISHYFRRREKEGFAIDDITWNDLDMDEVYQVWNHTRTSIGEEYLYAALRHPIA